MDTEANQFPHSGFKEQPQSEDCLFLNITKPTSLSHTPSPSPSSGSGSSSGLPVVVFLHGGAFFLGSSSRPYCSPLNFLTRSIETNHQVIFISINYRPSTLGFLSSPDVVPDSDHFLLPPNNRLHDQFRAFEWIHRNVGGLGGAPSRITAIGQSAGGMSLALHSISGNETIPSFRQMVG